MTIQPYGWTGWQRCSADRVLTQAIGERAVGA